MKIESRKVIQQEMKEYSKKYNKEYGVNPPIEGEKSQNMLNEDSKLGEEIKILKEKINEEEVARNKIIKSRSVSPHINIKSIRRSKVLKIIYI